MLHSTPSKVALHRATVAVCVKALIVALFLAAGADPALGAGSTATFTVSQALHNSIALGGSTQVYAAVGITGGSGAVSGTVSFYACAPSETVDGTCPAGTHIGSGTLDASSQTLSPAFMPTEGGIWCFRSAYQGNAVYAPSESTTACTQVTPITSKTTVAGPAEWAFGTGATANATVTGPSWAPVATGTVTFSLCPSDATGICTSDWTAIGSGILDGSGTATSPTFSATTTGTWCWHARYDGDASYRTSQGSGACFEVVGAPDPGDGTTDPDNGTTDPGNGTTDPGDGTTAPDDGTAPPTAERRGPGGWKHAEWPVESLELGDTTYTADEARAILAGPAKGDAGNILARHLIAAKLDRASGALDASADPAIEEADDLLASLGGPGAGTKMSKGTGGEVGRTIALLEGAAAGR